MTDQLPGAKLAEGACAEIFAWGDGGDRIVKLAKPNTNRFALERELRHCRIAWQLGLPVPQPFELVRVAGRDGIVFERARGESILSRFAAYALARTSGPGSQTEEDCLHARTTARALHLIHSHSSDALADQNASLRRDIGRTVHLTDEEKAAVLQQLDALPRKRQLCHGDPNPGNFLLSPGGVAVVDWNNATLGNPEADLAEYVLMLRHARLPAGTALEVVDLFEASRAGSIELFTREYQALSGVGAAEVEPWMAPIAARKLAADAISEAEKDALVAEVRSRLR